MKSFRLDLNSIERVKGFVSVISNFSGYFDLVSGRYVVDAKSIMGIFSMDLSKHVELRILETNEKISEIEKAIGPYLWKEA
ncbi:MAG: HPr family phosphocarrier protein [Lachnospiraceae bacterium]|nr:HPr family phosphocarrier protein [Lachnospiraceae bacterium]